MLLCFNISNGKNEMAEIFVFLVVATSKGELRFFAFVLLVFRLVLCKQCWFVNWTDSSRVFYVYGVGRRYDSNVWFCVPRSLNIVFIKRGIQPIPVTLQSWNTLKFQFCKFTDTLQESVPSQLSIMDFQWGVLIGILIAFKLVHIIVYPTQD